ncbi:MAG TPA: class I SAM-dependent methyltransferase [Planctomycetaceae bacterium]
MDKYLTAAERRRRERLEAVVDRGRGAYIEAAKALAEIRDKRLYRPESFAAYIRRRFGTSREWAYDMLRWYAVAARTGDYNLSRKACRLLAPMSPEKQMKIVAIARKLAPGADLTEDLLRRARTKLREKTGTPRYDCTFYLGRFQDVPPPEPASVSCVLVDPPYHRSWLPQWEELAAWSAACLKPGGRFLAYCGVGYLPEVLVSVAKHLSYTWTICRSQKAMGGFPDQLGNRTLWTPIVAFQRPPVSPLEMIDVLAAGQKSIEFHRWEKPTDELEKLLAAATAPGELCADPTAGSASCGQAAANLGRRFWGAESDPESYRIATKRLGLRKRKRAEAA